jgi:hypothetical protein
MGDVDVCIEFEMLKVKVPIIFLGTMGFSPPREGRYDASMMGGERKLIDAGSVLLTL